MVAATTLLYTLEKGAPCGALPQAKREGGASWDAASGGQRVLTKHGVRHREARGLARLLTSFQTRNPGGDVPSALPFCAGSYNGETGRGDRPAGAVALGPAPTDASRPPQVDALGYSDA